MIGEISTAVGLLVLAWGGYKQFVASKLDAHVEAFDGAAKLVVKNNRRHTAYLKSIAASKGAVLATYVDTPLTILGGNPWDPPNTTPAPKVARLMVDMEVPPGQTVTYPFRFFASSASSSRIRLEASESSLIAKTKTIDCPITAKAISAMDKSDTD